ncbi:MAG: class I SAM-dependent rRNA methyltransferase [Thioalkalispiraceae bacterium]|jgi:23S rRNA (cytosine1962-C5)-methyltransferase
MSQLPVLRLKKREERRLRAGHLWVYSNEVDVKATPLSGLEAGQQVRVESAPGRFMGQAYVNPNTLISARLFSARPEQLLDYPLIERRLRRALALREKAFSKPFYRLVYGESDALPGLVVDRFDQTLVVQINTAGMEAVSEQVLAVLDEVIKPAAILLRNDSPAREQEGLACYVKPVKGDVPELIELEENGTRFRAPLASGQKTGWYFDHRQNRQRLMHYAKGMRVLDMFSYIGAWGVQALAAGASEVVCSDTSTTFLEQAGDNAELNGCADRFTGLAGDAFDVLKALREENEKFDLVVLDPPAFIKRRKDFKEGAQAYQRLNRLAMQVVREGGMLVSASCSHHMPAAQLLDEIRKAGQKKGHFVQVMEQGHQGPDHPIHPAMRETEYLKAWFCRVSSQD